MKSLKIAVILFAIGFALSDDPYEIVGGNEAAKGQFPYQVGLVIPIFGFKCGGSILNKQWIITAAHCVVVVTDIPDYLEVFVGSNFVGKGDNYTVEKIFIHEKYNKTEEKNDVALLKIQKEIIFGDLVRPIDMASTDPAPGETAMASGWGRTNYPDGGASKTLQYLEVQLLSNTECRKLSYPIRPDRTISDDEICVLSENGHGMCHGDSGGPLVKNSQLIGIVSWAVVECAKGAPDVFMRVSSYKAWAEEIMAKNS